MQRLFGGRLQQIGVDFPACIDFRFSENVAHSFVGCREAFGFRQGRESAHRDQAFFDIIQQLGPQGEYRIDLLWRESRPALVTWFVKVRCLSFDGFGAEIVPQPFVK